MNLKIASRRRRFFAWYLDMFLITFITILAMFRILDIENLTDSPRLFIGMIIAIILFHFTLMIIKDICHGTSPGKYFFGITVRDENNLQQSPTKSMLILRNLLLTIWPIEAIISITRPDKKRLGDVIAKTMVVQIRKTKILGIVFFIIGLFLLMMASTSMMIRTSGAFKAATTYLSNNPEVKAQTGKITGYGSFPSGSVHLSNGSGKAALNISIHGEKRNYDSTILLSKEPGQDWHVENYDLEK